MDNYYYVHRYDSSKRLPEFLGPKHVSVLQNKTLLQNSSVFCQHTLEFSICWANVLCVQTAKIIIGVLACQK